jgi:hypothetical protein
LAYLLDQCSLQLAHPQFSCKAADSKEGFLDAEFANVDIKLMQVLRNDI